MNPKTIAAIATSVLLAAVAFVLNRRVGIAMAPGGTAPELNTEPG